ncbi:MAG: hypothetical protein OEU32_09195 [Acidimicrobiia bacterium]|nr:hypothetical protein [Acidimicrobiia bacterium]
MTPSLLFVHSPLVGPSSLRRLAQVCRTAGRAVALPDLTSATRASPVRWETFIEIAVAAGARLHGPTAVVAHSGAGAFLPAIGAAIDDLAALVFVDAVIPPDDGPHRTSDAMADLLDSKTVDGVLLPWLEWWPGHVVEQVLPDRVDRRTLAADMPRLPRGLYDEDVPVPSGWTDWPCRYLKLSAAYEQEYATAEERGWPSLSIDGAHLSTHTEPDVVRAAIDMLLE